MNKYLMILVCMMLGGCEVTTSTQHSSIVRGDAQKIVARVARDMGVRNEVAVFAVKKESNYNCKARNPSSTATGMLQVVRASAAAIVGRPVSRAELQDCEFGTAVGMAHLALCQDLLPGRSPYTIWRDCHYWGPANVGGDIRDAHKFYMSYLQIERNR